MSRGDRDESSIECDAHSEDITTPGSGYMDTGVKNVGAAPVSLTLSVIDLLSSDPHCPASRSAENCASTDGLVSEFSRLDQCRPA